MEVQEDNVITKIEARQSWDRARQAALFEGMLALTPFQSAADLLSFEEVKNKLRLSHKTYKGLQEIPLDRIRGSVGRYRDFTRTFLPRNRGLRDRWQRVNAFAATSGVPPIEVYQVGEAYFVLDGNHRVSVARQNKSDIIEAHVWEYAAPTGLSAQADLDELLIRSEYAHFLEHTQLDKLRPNAEIIFTAPGRYQEIEVQIELYRLALEKIDREPISFEDAVTAWYDMIYTPTIQIIHEQGVMERFPSRTEGDLFVWAGRYCRELQERSAEPVNLAQAAGAMANTPHLGMLGRAWRTLTDWLKPSQNQ